MEPIDRFSGMPVVAQGFQTETNIDNPVAPENTHEPVETINNSQEQIQQLLSDAKQCIENNKLESVSSLGINTIQQGYELMAAEFDKIRIEQKVTDEQLFQLTGDVNTFTNFNLDNLGGLEKIAGLPEICEIYKQLRLIFDGQIKFISQFRVDEQEMQSGGFSPPQPVRRPITQTVQNSNHPDPSGVNIGYSDSPENAKEAIETINTYQAQIQQLLSDAKQCIENNKLETVSSLGINAIQQAYESIATKIDKIRTEKKVTDEQQLVKLTGDINTLTNFPLENLGDLGKITGLPEICEIFKQLRSFFEGEIIFIKNYKKNVMAAVKQDGLALQFVNEKFREDRDVVLTAVNQNGLALQFVGVQFQNSREVVLTAVAQNGKSLIYASQQFQECQENILEIVRKNGLTLQYAKEEFRNKREIILAAVSNNGLSLQYANDEFKKNKELVLAAVNQNGLSLQHTSPEIQKDSKIVLLAVTQNGLALEYASNPLRDDEELVLAAVKQNGLSLRYAPQLQDDQTIVLASVASNGLALQYASNALRNNRNVVLKALANNASAFQYASEDLKKNDDFILMAMTKAGLVLEYTAYPFREKWEIVSAAVSQNGLALKYASEELQNDYKLVKIAVRQNGLSLQFASEKLRNNKDLALLAVTQNGLALEHVSDPLKNDKKLVLAAIKQNPGAFFCASSIMKRDRDVVEASVQKMGNSAISNTPSTYNVDEINLISLLQSKSEESAGEVLSRIGAVDDTMRGNVALIGEIFDRQIELITRLLATEKNKRDFDSANQQLKISIAECRQQQFDDYCSLISQRETIVEGGIEVIIDSDKKVELQRKWNVIMDEVFGKLGELNLTEKTNLDSLLALLKAQRKSKFESYNQMMDGKETLTNSLFQLQKEANRLYKIRCAWTQANDIWSACSTGNLDVLRTCIGKFWFWNKRAGVNALNREGYAPIHLAVFNNQVDALKLLLESEGDPCLCDRFGYQPLHLAAKNGFTPIVQILLGTAASINAPGEYGRTPLHMSVYNKRLESTECLLANGANINAQNSPDDASKTPLHDAVSQGNLSMVRLLTKNVKLNVMISDRNGCTPLYSAVMGGHVEIASLIVAHPSWRVIKDPTNLNHRNQLLNLKIPQNEEEMKKFLRILAE